MVNNANLYPPSPDVAAKFIKSNLCKIIWLEATPPITNFQVQIHIVEIACMTTCDSCGELYEFELKDSGT